jgi:hypothetical protein
MKIHRTNSAILKYSNNIPKESNDYSGQYYNIETCLFDRDASKDINKKHFKSLNSI